MRFARRAASVVDPEYLKYMDYLRNTPEQNWQPYREVVAAPRAGNIGDNHLRPVWGEDCRNKRHFDCDSFVNYVLTKTTKKPWGFTQPQYMTMSRPDYWTEVDRTAPPVDGDILLRAGRPCRAARRRQSCRPGRTARYRRSRRRALQRGKLDEEAAPGGQRDLSRLAVSGRRNSSSRKQFAAVEANVGEKRGHEDWATAGLACDAAASFTAKGDCHE